MRTIIIDDNKKDVNHLQENLAAIRVLKTFNSGKVNIEEIEALHPDVIFMNIHSPQCVSVELLQYLANNHLPIHIIFITEKEMPEKNNMIYIKKPFNKIDLIEFNEFLMKVKQERGKNKVQKSEPVHICLFKHFHFKNEDEIFYNVKWRTAKTRELLVYLIQHYQEIVRKDVLVELLWPNISADKAYDNLYATIYYLRKLLRSLNIDITINNTVHGYEIELHQVEVDIILFEKKIEKIDRLLSEEANKTEVLAAFKKLQNIYVDEYLAEESYDWKEHKKEEFSIKFLALAKQVIHLLMTHQDYTEAILLALHLQKLYPYMDYSYFQLMKLYSKFGDPYNVEKQYLKLKEMLEEEFSGEPNAEIRKWHQEWIQNQNN